MNGIDIGIISIMFISSAAGIWRGLTKEALGLVSWIGAGLAAYILLPAARHFAQGQIQNPVIADIVAAFVIFILFLVFFSLISYIIASYIKNSALSGIDRSLGFGFGILRGTILLCAFELVLSSFIPRAQYPQVIQQARFIPMVQSGSEKLLAILPHDVQDFVMSKQLKFLQEQGRKELESHLEDVIEDRVKESVNGILKTPLPERTSQTQAQTPTTLAAKQELKPAEKVDPQKAMEALAKLNVQTQPKKEKQGYANEQRGDLDRLIGTVR